MAAIPDARRRWLPAVLFLAVVPAVAHALFSSLGFNPTDDGFTLAYSRRLLDGQVPHRDFIIIRPFLSPLLHVPVVLLGGSFTFLLSRYCVWLELAAIAWIWIHVVERLLDRRFPIVQRAALALISMIASVHTFPIMAWHTLDGLLFTVAGMAVCVDPERTRWKPAGYFLMGLATLCKQSFLPAPFLALALLGDWRRTSCWSAALLPAALYAGFLLTQGALGDGIDQLVSQQAFWTVGVLPYFRGEVVAGMLVGALALIWIQHDQRRSAGPFSGFVIGSLAPALLTLLALPDPGLSAALAYGLFGMLAGYVVVWLLHGRALESHRLRLALLALIVAWSASLSIGYHVPTLGSGELLAVLLGHALTLDAPQAWTARARTPAMVALTIVALAVFGVARTRHVYREGTFESLSYPLDRVLPGASRIHTNLHTYLYMRDLQSAVDRAGELGDSYTILPGCAGWWVRSTSRNALSIDWAQGTELARNDLVDRAVAELELCRGRNVVIVQKAEADVLAGGFVPLRDRYAVVRYVRRNFEKVAETPLFELYR